jgi:Mn2+/Fe2+ NRAMP family transporter
VKKIFEIALGILAAIGGFVDIGDIVFNVAAGAMFQYELLWVVVVGVGAIVTYSEMCGRVAVVSQHAVFDAVRERLGFSVGLVALLAAQLVNLMTLAAEVGGIALALQLLAGLPFRVLLVLALVALWCVLWFLPFGWIERIFGYCGLAMLVFAVAAIKLHPDWDSVASGFVPHAPSGDLALYAYFTVGLIGAATVPYEVYFYSSGAIEEEWTPRDLEVNKANSIIGYTLGGLLSFALMIAAGALLFPMEITPESLGSAALLAEVPLGQIGLVLALIGILFAVGGAAVDTALSGGYNLAQFFGWEWGKHRKPVEAPRYSLTWMVLLLLGFLIVMTGVDPIKVTEFSVIFSALALPATYLPILLVANDRAYMGGYVNGRVANVFGFAYLVIIFVVAVAAIPLMIITNMGQG